MTSTTPPRLCVDPPVFNNTSAVPRRFWTTAVMMTCAALLVACSSTPPQTPVPSRTVPPPPVISTTAPAASAISDTQAPTPSAASAPTAPTAVAAVAPTTTATPPTPILPFEEAVLLAANRLFGNATIEPIAASTRSGATRFPLVIDPLVDGNSGFQTAATESMEARITQLLKAKYPAFDVQPFNSATLARSPLLFIGTFTAVNMDGSNKPGRDWHRVCLALVDMRSGTIVSKGFARAALEGVDMTPTAFYLDSPAWAPDPATTGYVKTCQGTKPGDAINPAYWDRIMAAAMVNDGTLAYNQGRYEEALDLYRGVSRQPGGDQLRVHQGIYLSAAKLGRKEEATQAFGRLVDFGMAQKQLGVKFLFRPGSTLFPTEPQISRPYPMWLSQLSARATQRNACLSVAGHSSRTGPEPLNERLSLMRAQAIKSRLEVLAPALRKHLRAEGLGSSQNISGLGTDDARDALDRRVEFKVIDCPTSTSG